MARTLRDIDLCELVAACAKAGVTRFKHGSLEINFGKAWNEWGEIPSEVANSEDVDDNEVGEQDEADLRQRQSDELLIEDPEAYERLHLGEEI